MGFWSTLAKVAGDVGGSFIGDPMLGNQVVGAIQGITGWDTGGGGGGAGGAANNAGSAASANSAAQGQEAARTGNQNLAAGGGNLGASGDAYRTALNGSQEQLQSLLGPEVSTVMSQYDNAAKEAATFGPRGGGRTAKMAELPFAKAGAAGQLLSSARAGAATGASDVGGKQSQIGAQLSGQATGQLGPALAPGMQQSGFKNTNDLAAGQGIGKILGNIFNNKAGDGGGIGGMFGKGGGPSGGDMMNFNSDQGAGLID